MLLALVAGALAYETDQITHRADPLEDVSAAADAEVDRMLAMAVRETNRITACAWKTPATQRLLAYQVYRVTSHAEYVHNRGELAGLGYGAYAAWLEAAPIARRTFTDRSDIYGDLKPTEAFVLGSVGVASTVRIGGVLMGTDKPDHFFSQGFEYFVTSRFGKNDARAVDWGTASERGAYGLLTSDTFSWADLYANWQGYTFYRSLLDKGSVLVRGEDGCVVAARSWDWTEWLDDAADEVLNPPVYTPHVGEAVRARLAREKDQICAGYAEWGPAADLRRSQIVSRELPHVGAKAPERRDEWQLDQLCAPDVAGQ